MRHPRTQALTLASLAIALVAFGLPYGSPIWVTLIPGVAALLLVRAARFATAWEANVAAYQLAVIAAFLWSYRHRGPHAAHLTAAMALTGIALALVAIGLIGTREHLVRALPVLFSGVIVAFISGGAGSAGGWAEWLVERFHLPLDQAELIVHFGRKGIHFAFFGLVGLFAWLWLRTQNLDLRRIALLAVLWSASLGTFDEVRQSFHRDRTGSPWDVLIDSGGALCFVGFCTWRARGIS